MELLVVGEMRRDDKCYVGAVNDVLHTTSFNNI